MAKNFISEDDIEQAILSVLEQEHGYELLNCYTSDANDLDDKSNRTDKYDVILFDRLKQNTCLLNPTIPESAIDHALERFYDRRRAMSTIEANREIDKLIRNGIAVEFDDSEGRTQHERVRVIDFNPSNENHFLAVSQLWIKGEHGYRRPDIILYVNGLPLVFIELKNSNVKLRNAYNDNLTNYKKDIPQLFHANAICILSNAIETKVGSFNAGWEYFFPWLRTEDEKEKVDRKQIAEEGTSLQRAVAGLCAPRKLLDYIENFIIYHNQSTKIIAQNHQFIGVNNAFDAFVRRDELKGKLGVFWHTQGSGKSFSMIFYVRKIFRKLVGDFTFVVITDRDDLDGQIYRNFLNTETVKEKEAARPKDSQQMREFLSGNKRIIFTLIHKFRYDKGKKYPLLSDRDDIVVIVDEAHRTQYKSLAENMRKGLPKAQYLAFTGTPLLGRQRKTNAWFGDYVSEYNFQQSMDDGATVPLFYEKRVPEMLIQNDDLSEEFYEILEDENLDEAQQEKLERKFATELEVIKRPDRLDVLARDIVYHFPRRGYLGKGMIVSIDKFTAVRMYDRVNRFWKEEIKALRGQIKKIANEVEKQRLKKRLDYMRAVEMAVVVSEDADEEKKFAKEGLHIKPHRQRMNQLDEQGHDIEYNFKDPSNPLQLVFVCAMWLTGFDAPTVSTLYLDKPMKDHTLMQTIARANRVSGYEIDGVSKRNGEIVDYYNVFRNMKKALNAYAQGDKNEKPPVQEKEELFNLLDQALGQTLDFCSSKEIDLESISREQATFKNIELFKTYADTLLSKDEWRKEFQVYENTVTALYEACKPEILGKNERPLVAIFQYLRKVIDAVIGQQDIDEICRKITDLLDESVVVDAPDEFVVKDHAPEWQIKRKGKQWDLSKIDFDKLREDFKEASYKHVEITDLRGFIEDKLKQLLEKNSTRTDFAQRLQEIIDQYNSGGSTTENYYEDLLKYAQRLRAEEERHIREGLSEDELELFDLLKKEKMTKAEEREVKLAARSLLQRLIEERPKVLVQDWYKDTQSKARVRSAIEKVLNERLPQSYDRMLFKAKCDRVYQTVYDYASQGRRWAA